ncbi:MAG TPA: DUF881 domain-containing protein [Marmoricola sp.]|jgi:uncharacterized protein YlxW (UPF0749 family)|nr:DUF881 domain-containing protein [Marmoricola sp.]
MNDTPQPDHGAEQRPAPSAWQRLRRPLVHPGRGQVVVGVLLFVLGAGAVTQLRLVGDDDPYAGMRQPELIQVLNGLNAASRRTEREIDQLEQTRDSLRNRTERRQTALEQARTELTALGILAGTLPATGPGIRITIEVKDGTLTTNQLLDGIQELRDAGAEAMEINDSVRVVAQTSFDDTLDGLEVDGTVLQAPYVIDVIGDPDTLATALGIPGGFKEDVVEGGGEFTIEKLEKVDVSVLRTPAEPRFAKPVEGQ